MPIIGGGSLIFKVGGGYSLLGGGDDRGNGAIDLQYTRGADAQVASGDYSVMFGGKDNKATGYYSFIGGGAYNTASGYYAVCVGGYYNTVSETLSGYSYTSFIGGGWRNTASGYYAICVGGAYNTASGFGVVNIGGYNNVANGSYATCLGGFSNTASGYYSLALGNMTLADKYGQFAHSQDCFGFSNYSGNKGNAQYSTMLNFIQTTNATPTIMKLDRWASRIMTIREDAAWTFNITVVAKRTDADDESAGYQFLGVIDNQSGTTALVGAVAKTVIAEDDASWDADVTADDANDALIITVTGAAGKTIQWVARIDTVETSNLVTS